MMIEFYKTSVYLWKHFFNKSMGSVFLLFVCVYVYYPGNNSFRLGVLYLKIRTSPNLHAGFIKHNV